MPSYYQPNKHLKRKERELRRKIKEESRRQPISRRAPKSFSETSALIGRIIAEARKSAGMTQVKLSELAKTTQSVIARTEKGRHNLTANKLEEIAKALGKKLKIELT